MKLLQPHRLSTALAAGLMTVGLTAGSASAAITTIITTADGNGADARVTRANPDSNYGASEELLVGRSSSSSGSETGLAYFKFDLSSINLEVTNATFKVSITGASTNDSGVFRMFVLEDGFSNPNTGAVEDFVEGSGDGFDVLADGDPANDDWLRDSNAPAREFPDTTDIFDEDDGNDFDAMNQFASVNFNVGAHSAGDVYQGSSSVLIDAINNDTNDVLVIGIRGSQNFDDFVFASKENSNIGTGNFIAPTLEAEVIPEPASAALLGLGGLMIAGRRRQRG